MISAFLIHGDSMMPGLRDGDVVLACAARRTLRAGDRIVYRERTRGFLVAHRVRHITTCGAVLAGDASLCADPLPVQNDQILGRIVAVIPHIGKWAGKLNAFAAMRLYGL